MSEDRAGAQKPTQFSRVLHASRNGHVYDTTRRRLEADGRRLYFQVFKDHMHCGTIDLIRLRARVQQLFLVMSRRWFLTLVHR